MQKLQHLVAPFLRSTYKVPGGHLIRMVVPRLHGRRQTL